MSMAAWPKTKEIICGINSSEDSLKSGVNQNCRKFVVQDSKYVLETVIEHDIHEQYPGWLLRLALVLLPWIKLKKIITR